MSKFCSSCGKEINENAVVCVNCGCSVKGGNSDSNAKSKLVAGLLGIFFGAWGVHNFYLGNSGRGVLQIFLTIITCGIAGLWGFIEGIMILAGSICTDAEGNPLKD